MAWMLSVLISHTEDFPHCGAFQVLQSETGYSLVLVLEEGFLHYKAKAES